LHKQGMSVNSAHLGNISNPIPANGSGREGNENKHLLEFIGPGWISCEETIQLFNNFLGNFPPA